MKPLHSLFLVVFFVFCQPVSAADTAKKKPLKKPTRTVLTSARAAKPTTKAAVTPVAPLLTEVQVAPTQLEPQVVTEVLPVPPAVPPVALAPQLRFAVPPLPEMLASYKDMVVHGLPSIKTVYPTGEKPLVVFNLKCPAEVLTGEVFAIPNAIRSGVNAALEGVSNTNLLPFNLQLVCS